MAKDFAVSEPIVVLGASQNNLQNIDVSIPGNSLTVVTGVSGSGKSSLAFDTLYAEGQRRYVESLSSYARQFLERISKPNVREIRGLSPAIAIRQKNATRNPRSTVGTVTEIYDFLRLLYARVGTVICRGCGRKVQRDTVDRAVAQLMQLPEGRRLYIAFPFKRSALDLSEGAESERISLDDLVENLLRQGFFRLLQEVDGDVAGRILNLNAGRPSTISELNSAKVLVDRIVIGPDAPERLADSVQMSFAEGNGIAEVLLLEPEGPAKSLTFSERFECPHCAISYSAPEPRLFSFNNPYGACSACHGFGNIMSIDRTLVIPDLELSLEGGAVNPFSKPRYRRFQRRLLEWAERREIPVELPYRRLTEEAQELIWQGDEEFIGVKGFFRYLSRKKYKMHVRIFMARYRGYSKCHECNGERLRREARDVQLDGRRITELTRLSVARLSEFFHSLQIPPEGQAVAEKLLLEIRRRLEFLAKVGLEYLNLDRLTSSLSGGEMQRIHLAASLSSSLVGTLYVLDEPSVGLHPRDQGRLIAILKQLRDHGNTIVVVEHEREIIESADHVIDIGPGAGERGGRVLHSGDLPSLLKNPNSLTGKYLREESRLSFPVFRRNPFGPRIAVKGARHHNLMDIDVEIPLGVLTCVTGVSGSGKSTLVEDVLYAGIKKRRKEWKQEVGACDDIEGWDRVSDVIMVDQSPIGRTPRSNPVTYMKAFDEIRKLFSDLREAQARNLSPAHFSFNVAGGRCEGCNGSGVVTVEMQFLADVELECEDCRGARFQKKVLEVAYRGKNIYDVLNLTADEAIEFFSDRPPVVRKLKILREVGLGYLRLGQSATTLSGGEAQRIKLALYLSRNTRGNPLFILDEPTTGLHLDDIGKLLKTFDRLIAGGATVLVIEHNLEVIQSADWIVDLGPEGGEFGGRLIAAGRPEEVAQCAESHTGSYLKRLLAKEKVQN